MTTWKFWRDALERGVRAFASSLLALILAVEGFNVFNAEWVQMLGTAVTAAVISILVSLSVSNVGETGSASALRPPP